MTIPEAIRNHQDQILTRWKERVFEEIPEARRQEKSAIENSVPCWLEALTALLENADDKQIVFNSQEHALDRSRFQIYSLKHIVREYNLLKHEIFKVTDQNGGVDPHNRNLIMYAIDLSIE